MKKIVIFDLDGTLSDPTHRLPLIQGKNANWKMFYEESQLDPPIWQGIDLMNMYFKFGYFVWIFTGRSAAVFDDTSEWLIRFGARYHTLKMRGLDDFRTGAVMKKMWLHEWAISMDDPDKAYSMIKVAVDDDDVICKMYHDLGIPTFKIIPGALDEGNN